MIPARCTARNVQARRRHRRRGPGQSRGVHCLAATGGRVDHRASREERDRRDQIAHSLPCGAPGTSAPPRLFSDLSSRAIRHRYGNPLRELAIVRSPRPNRRLRRPSSGRAMTRSGMLVCTVIFAAVAGCDGGPASPSGVELFAPGRVSMTFTGQDQTFTEAAEADPTPVGRRGAGDRRGDGTSHWTDVPRVAGQGRDLRRTEPRGRRRSADVLAGRAIQPM